MNTKKNKNVGNDRKRQKSASTDPTPSKKQKNNKNKNNKNKHDNAKTKALPPQYSSTETSSNSTTTIPTISIPVNHKSLLLDSTTPFHLIPTQNDIQTQTLEDSNKITSNPSSLAQMEELRKTASDLYSHELSLFTSLNPKTSDDRWISGTIRKGTYKDKIAAMSVQISSHPNHKLHIISKLLSLCQNSPTRIGHIGAEALSDLFINTLLPPNRKLIPWNRRPLLETLSSNPSPRTLLLWHVEDLVKSTYAQFLSYLSRILESSAVAVDKIAALRLLSQLLTERMEGEGVLLSAIVNKIGDPMRKVAERAGEVLRRGVLGVHPAMNVVVAREVSQFAHRPGLSPRALYNAIIFLNQMRLERDATTTLAGRLIETYIGLFAAATSNDATASSSEDDSSCLSSRLLGALLTGINRARPYCAADDDAVGRLAAKANELYGIVHLTNRPMASVQSLMLLQQIESSSSADGNDNRATTTPSARFHRALYAKLAQPSFLESKKASTLAFHLVYRTIKRDDNDERRLSYAKRLLMTAAAMTTSPPPPLCGSLFLLSKVHVTQGWEENIPERQSTENKRDPVSGGSLWEITLLRRHYHPSVSHFAESLLSNRKIDYKGDPLKDFSNMKFLDRLAYRQPKRLAKKTKGGGEEQQENVFKKVILGGGKSENPVNEEAFWGEQNKRVGVEDEFFVKFFRDKEKREGGKEKETPINEKNIDLENNDSDTDPEEEEFANALAEKLMESAGNGRANYDDEDPDMEGWSSPEDMSDDDDDDGNGENVDFAAMDGLEDDDDDVEDASDSDDDVKLIDDDDDDSSVGNVDVDDDDDDAFMDGQNDDDSSDDEAAAAAFDKPKKKTFKTIQQKQHDEEEKQLTISKTKGKKKTMKKLSTQFHDASEYEELIAKRYAEEKLLKQQQQKQQSKQAHDDNAINQQKEKNDESKVTNKKEKPKETTVAATTTAGVTTNDETTKKNKARRRKNKKKKN